MINATIRFHAGDREVAVKTSLAAAPRYGDCIAVDWKTRVRVVTVVHVASMHAPGLEIHAERLEVKTDEQE